MPYAKLFRSRWAALLWAGGIVWGAVEFVGVAPAKSGDETAVIANTSTGDPVADNNLAIFANVMKDN